MGFDPVSAGFEFAKQLTTTLGKFIPDAEKAQQAAIEIQAQANGVVMGQIALLQADATSPSKFVTWWRPGVGWICLGGMGYQLIVRPLLQSGANVWIPAYTMVSLDIETLMTLLFSMLGLGAYRTYEKTQGVSQ